MHQLKIKSQSFRVSYRKVHHDSVYSFEINILKNDCLKYTPLMLEQSIVPKNENYLTFRPSLVQIFLHFIFH